MSPFVRRGDITRQGQFECHIEDNWKVALPQKHGWFLSLVSFATIM